jgi:hypothetical protein
VCTENPIRIDWLGVVTLSQTEPNLPTTANLDPRDFIDLACWLIVQTGPISLNVTTPIGLLIGLKLLLDGAVLLGIGMTARGKLKELGSAG